MSKAVIEDWDLFYAYLATQPLCKWSAQKQQQIARGTRTEQSRFSPQPQNSNAELAAALALMS